jgi:ribonuclease HI
VEAMAVWTASKLVGLLGFKDIILKGDSLEVVQEVRREERSWSNFGNLIEETKKMLHICHSWKIQHVRRTANETAHKVAKMAVSLNICQLWLSMTPLCIRDIVITESVI